MTREHDALRDLVAPVALGAAAPHEIARVEAHAEECAVCREELESLRQAADVLAVSVPQHEPGPALKQLLMATVRADAAARETAEAPAPAPAPRRAPRGRRLFGLPAWPAAAVAASLAAVALAIGLGVELSGSDSPAVRTVAVHGTPDAPGITGKVTLLPGADTTAVVDLAHLKRLPAGEAYQLWVVRAGVPVSAGFFQGAGDSARAVVTDVSGADALAVTAQARTNTATPVPPILLNAEL